MTTLSGFISNYNMAEYVGTAIEAAMHQTRPLLELLIMDDASTDNSWEVLQSYANKYENISIYRSPFNRGYSLGINELLQKAKGDFVHFGSADDMMFANFAEITLGLADKYPTSGVITCAQTSGLRGVDGRITNPNLCTTVMPNIHRGYVTPQQFSNWLDNYEVRSSWAPSTIYNRNAVMYFGRLPVQLSICDVTFILNACALKYGMSNSEEAGYIWYQSPCNWTTRVYSNAENIASMKREFSTLVNSPKFKGLFSDLYIRRWLNAH